MAVTTEHVYRHTHPVWSVPKENCEGPKICRYNSTINFLLHSTEPSPPGSFAGLTSSTHKQPAGHFCSCGATNDDYRSAVKLRGRACSFPLISKVTNSNTVTVKVECQQNVSAVITGCSVIWSVTLNCIKMTKKTHQTEMECFKIT